MANKVFEIAFRLNGQLASGFTGALGQAKSSLSEYAGEITNLKTKQKSLQASLRDVQASQRSLNAAMDDAGVGQHEYRTRMEALEVKATSYRRTIANLEAQQKKLNDKYKEGKISAAQYDAGIASTNAKLTQQKSRLADVTAEQNRLTAAFNRGRVSEEQYRAKMDELNAKAKEYTQGLKEVGSELDRVSAKNTAARAKMAAYSNSKANFASARADLAATTVAVGAMAAPFIAAGAAAVNFETAMAGVAKQVDGARDENMQYTQTYYDMKDSVQAMSVQMGILPDKVAAATAASARMGVKGAEGIKEFTETALKMGEAFETDSEVVATSMAQIANIRDIKLDTSEGRAQLKDLADTINYLDDQTVAKGGDIINVLQRISGTAGSTSFTNNELAALSTTMLETGASSEVAATGLNAMINKLSTAPANTSKAFHAALAQLGFDAKKLQTDFTNDSKGTMMNLLEQINKLDKGTKAEVLTNLFGAEYQDDVAKLASGVDKLRGNFEKLNDAARVGSIDKEFAARMETTSGKLSVLQSSATVAAVAVGDVLLPHIANASMWLANNAVWLANLAKEYPGVTEAIVTMAGSVGGLVVAYKGFKTVSSGIDAAKDALDLLALSQKRAKAAQIAHTVATKAGTAASRIATIAQWAFNSAMWANPVTWIVVGIVALVAALVWLAYNWDTVKEVAVACWQWIGNQAEWLWGVITSGFDAVVNWLSSGWESTKQFASDAWNAAWNAMTAFVDNIQVELAEMVGWVQEKWGELKAIVSNPITAAVNWISNQVGGPVGGNVTTGHAYGDIVKKGAHLAWFAEKWDEAYIPINNSERSKNLWRETGKLLGMDAEMVSAVQQVHPAATSASIPSTVAIDPERLGAYDRLNSNAEPMQTMAPVVNVTESPVFSPVITALTLPPAQQSDAIDDSKRHLGDSVIAMPATMMPDMNMSLSNVSGRAVNATAAQTNATDIVNNQYEAATTVVHGDAVVNEDDTLKTKIRNINNRNRMLQASNYGLAHYFSTINNNNTANTSNYWRTAASTLMTSNAINTARRSFVTNEGNRQYMTAPVHSEQTTQGAGILSLLRRIGGAPAQRRSGGDSISISMPVTITIQGSATPQSVEKIKEVIRQETENLERKLYELQHRKERLSLA